MIEHEYRILIDNIPAIDGWSADFNQMTSRMRELRDVNPRSIVTMEISPWYNREEGGEWYCPGCEYNTCPINMKRK